MDIARLGIAVDSSPLATARGELAGFTSAGGRAEAAAQSFGRATVVAGANAERFGNQMRGSAGHTANLTAQLNDIGIMLASGQNPLQLALQQGTQINQVFAQMGGQRAALRGIGQALVSMVSPLNLATIGIIAGGAALTQFALEAFAAEDAISDFEDALEGVEDVTSSLKSVLDDLALTNAELAEQFTIGADSARRFIQLNAELTAAGAEFALRSQIDVLDEIAEGYTSTVNAGRVYRNLISRIMDDFGVLRPQAEALETALEAVFKADNLDESIAALQNLDALMKQYGVSASALPPEFRAAYQEAVQLASESDKARAILAQVVDEAGNLVSRLDDATDAANAFVSQWRLLEAARTANLSIEEEIAAGLADAERSTARLERSSRARVTVDREALRVLRDQERVLEDQALQHALIAAAVRETGDYWEEIYRDVARELERVDEILSEPGRELATGLVEGLIAGDAGRVFDGLGRRAAAAFVNSVFSGQSAGQAIRGSISGIQSGLNVLSSATGITSALTGIGSVLSAALPVVGAISAVVGLISGFSSTKITGAGLEGEIGPDADVLNFTRKKKSSFFGLVSSSSTNRDVNVRATNAIQSAASAVLDNVNALAEGMGGAARDLSDITTKFKIDTRGMNSEEVQAALEAELSAYENRIALAALGTRRFTEDGETSAETLARLSGALQTFNGVAQFLGTVTLPETIRKANRASQILASVGGEQAFTQAADVFFNSFLSPEEQLSRLEAELSRSAGAFGISGIDTREGLASAVFGAEGQGAAQRVAELISLAPLIDSVETLRDALEAGATAASDAAAAEAALAAERVASEAYALETRLLELQGDTVALRARERELLDESNRALLDQIFALEDKLALDQRAAEEATAAAQAAAGVASEISALERELLQARGDEAEIARRDRAALLSDEARAIFDQIRAAEEATAAAQAAADAERELADARREALGVVDGYEFATYYDEQRARADALAGRGVFTSYQNPFGDAFGELVNAMRLVVANTARTADNTEDSLALAAAS